MVVFFNVGPPNEDIFLTPSMVYISVLKTHITIFHEHANNSPSHHGLNLVKQVVNYEKFHFFVKDGDRIEPGGRGNISQVALFIKIVRMIKTRTLPPCLLKALTLTLKKVLTGTERGTKCYAFDKSHAVTIFNFLWLYLLKCFSLKKGESVNKFE